jgi:putative flavoprotein involved in K+ transport
MQHVETLIIGGGQAGLAMSYHLQRLGREHLILERTNVADRWRTQRWDSLMFQFPNWSITLPGRAYSGDHPDDFSDRDAVLRFIEDYAVGIHAPVKTRTNVIALQLAAHGDRYLVISGDGDFVARNVVIATGPYQRPHVPAMSAGIANDILQFHASDYRNPTALPDGAVLVVGSGASGCQIAGELLEAQRRVYLSVSRHDRLPRRYRGRDVLSWLVLLGYYETAIDELPEVLRTARFLFTGVRGGYDVDLRRSESDGMTLLGHLSGINDGRLSLAPDLAQNLDGGDTSYRAFLRAVDEHVSTTGIDAPPDVDKRARSAQGAVNAELELDMRAAGIRSVIWATGYRFDFNWVALPIFNPHGAPIHTRGVTAAPGVFFLGLKRQHTLKSSLLCGVGDDAAYLAEVIAGTAKRP